MKIIKSEYINRAIKKKDDSNDNTVENCRFFNVNIRASKYFITAFLIIVALVSVTSVSYAKKPTTYLAPGYQNITSSVEKSILPVGFMVNELKTDENKIVEVKPGFDQHETRFKTAFISVPLEAEKYNLTDMVSYLKNSEVAADSVKLRHIARMKKLDIINKSGDDRYGQYYKNFVLTPILVCPFGSGGCAMSHAPSYMGYNTNVQYFFNSYIKITDGVAKVADRIKNDTLCLAFAHENAHAIMLDMYLKDWSKLKSVSTSGHDGPIVSDRKLAYTEGWAEAFEAIYGQMNPLLVKESEREKYGIAEFQFTRQDPVRRNRYIWQNYKGKKSGILKNGLQILSTEGAIAATFFDIMTSRKIEDPFIKSVSVMYKYRPADFIEFINCWVKEYSGDKRVLYRIFLEETKYVTMSNEARKLYYDYYQAGVKFKQGKIDQKTSAIARNKWLAYKEELFQKAMAGARIDSNVSPDLWLNLKVPAKDGKADINVNINISLFEADARIIKRFEAAGITEAELVEFIKAREAMGVLPYKTATEALTAAFGAEKTKAFITRYKASNI